MEKGSRIRLAFRAAFPHTVPILAGFLFLGMAYGIYMQSAGFPFWYPTLSSATVFGGSLEFVLVSMLQGAFAPLQNFLMALLIQARHVFYGIAMLERYKGMGRKKGYLIFGMCDESFSINCTAQVPAGADRGWFYFFVTLLDQLYWVSGATLGGVLGTLLQFNTEGLDFVMTAMFTVIFLNQWEKDRVHLSAFVGLGSSLLCLLIFGPEAFLLPAMGCILVLLTLLRGRIGEGGEVL